MKPSEYWQRQGYSTFQQEYVSTDEIERIGINNIMWGRTILTPTAYSPIRPRPSQRAWDTWTTQFGKSLCVRMLQECTDSTRGDPLSKQ